ncbi:MAG: PSD1 and planctomycete cytochrome C domain-containing protein [Planctomycetota bacterium]
MMGLLILSKSGVAEPAKSDEIFFENNVRSILTRYCISCHNPQKHKGGLDLTSRKEAFKGGDSGPPIIAGKPSESLLIDVISYNSDIQMPPKGKMPDSDLLSLKNWVASGAIWPDSAKLIATTDPDPSKPLEHTGPKLRSKPFQINDQDKSWWSFQPIRKPQIPDYKKDDFIGNEIDALLLHKLKDKDLHLNPSATRRELIRRAYFDLIGLPPSPEAVIAFENDIRPNAWEKLIDDLLARPQYGERWARHWLDLVRFAETNGYERDGEKPNAWRYRDYIINSFNADKPYNTFLTEQIAGDEMGTSFNADRIIATGFYRLHVWDDEPDSTQTAEFDDLDDIMVTTSATFMGLTMGCVRCHDHKYDPISQSDYYQFLAFFRSLNPYGQHKTGGGGRGTGRITRPLAIDSAVQKWNQQNASELKIKRDQLALEKSEPARKLLTQAIARMESGADAPFGIALAIAEDPVKPTYILRRGEANNPSIEVAPGFPQIFGHPSPSIVPPTHQTSSGRRLALARWMSSKDNPLTARVFANRLWQHHFVRGVVPTPNDFGRTGELPSHPELLDFLADNFISNGFRIKPLHKKIMMSRAYCMSSRANNPIAISKDEANLLFWRQNPRRIEAEVLRDSILSFSHSLNLKRGGPGIYPALPEEVYKTQDSARKGWPESSPEEQNRRSIYIFVKRALVPPILEVFDCPTTTVPIGTRAITTVAPQALMLLNDTFIRKQAAILAARLQSESGNQLDHQIQRGFEIVLQRQPSSIEARIATNYIRQQSSNPNSADMAMTNFCLSLLNLNEVIYVD